MKEKEQRLSGSGRERREPSRESGSPERRRRTNSTLLPAAQAVRALKAPNKLPDLKDPYRNKMVAVKPGANSAPPRKLASRRSVDRDAGGNDHGKGHENRHENVRENASPQRRTSAPGAPAFRL